MIGDSLVKGMVEDPALNRTALEQGWEIRVKRGGKIFGSLVRQVITLYTNMARNPTKMDGFSQNYRHEMVLFK